jgi:hypothetical protein
MAAIAIRADRPAALTLADFIDRRMGSRRCGRRRGGFGRVKILMIELVEHGRTIWAQLT